MTGSVDNLTIIANIVVVQIKNRPIHQAVLRLGR